MCNLLRIDYDYEEEDKDDKEHGYVIERAREHYARILLTASINAAPSAGVPMVMRRYG